MVIIELQNLINSLTLAKLNTVSPTILDNEDINTILNNGNFSQVSVSDILFVSNVKVFQLKNLISFHVRYPEPSAKN